MIFVLGREKYKGVGFYVIRGQDSAGVRAVSRRAWWHVLVGFFFALMVL